MTSNLVSGILFLQGNDGKIIVIRVVRTIHDVHTDAHLEHDFVPVLVLVLVLDPRPVRVLACSCSVHPLWVRSFPQWLLFSTRSGFFSSVGGYCWCSCELLFVLDCPDPVSAPGRRHLLAPNSNNLCNMRSLLRQGLGCPRADPRVHHRTLFNVLRVVWEIPASL